MAYSWMVRRPQREPEDDVRLLRPFYISAGGMGLRVFQRHLETDLPNMVRSTNLSLQFKY